MKNFDDKEINFIMECCTTNLKLTIGNLNDSQGRNAKNPKYVMSKLDDVMYQHTLLKKLHSMVKDNKDKNKLSISGVKNLDIISDDELMERISDGTLDDPKLETTLFPNGK